MEKSANKATISEEMKKNKEIEKLKAHMKHTIEENSKAVKDLTTAVKNNPTGNTTINNYNKMTINVFLNEKCKNAMNLTDFVKNLTCNIEDLMYTKDNGYIKGIENIFTKQLQDLPPTERPIHCSDKKRMQFYVKEDDEWQKDDTHVKLDKTLSDLTVRQIHELKKWEELHPNYLTNDKEMKHWQRLVSEITGNSKSTKSGKKPSNKVQ